MPYFSKRLRNSNTDDVGINIQFQKFVLTVRDKDLKIGCGEFYANSMIPRLKCSNYLTSFELITDPIALRVLNEKRWVNTWWVWFLNVFRTMWIRADYSPSSIQLKQIPPPCLSVSLFVCLSVCLSVCSSVYSRSTQKLLIRFSCGSHQEIQKGFGIWFVKIFCEIIRFHDDRCCKCWEKG